MYPRQHNLPTVKMCIWECGYAWTQWWPWGRASECSSETWSHLSDLEAEVVFSKMAFINAFFPVCTPRWSPHFLFSGTWLYSLTSLVTGMEQKWPQGLQKLCSFPCASLNDDFEPSLMGTSLESMLWVDKAMCSSLGGWGMLCREAREPRGTNMRVRKPS